jgi:hypothetical protein
MLAGRRLWTRTLYFANCMHRTMLAGRLPRTRTACVAMAVDRRGAIHPACRCNQPAMSWPPTLRPLLRSDELKQGVMDTVS